VGFHDVEFPRNISYGSSGGIVHNTAVIELPSGKEQRISRSGTPRAVFDVAYAIKRMADLVTVRDFQRARQGRAHSFRYWDPLDYSTASTQTPWNDDTVDPGHSDSIIGTGDGSTTTFQLAKHYVSGSVTRSRAITKPISGTVRVSLGGVEQMSGWSVNTDTGVVTFTSAPGNGVVVRAGFKFNVAVRFEDDELNVSVDDFEEGSCPPIRLVEDIGDAQLSDLYPFRGASTQTIDDSISYAPSMGEFVRVDATGSGLVVRLPNFAAYYDGHNVVTFENIGSNDFDVEYAGASLGTVAAGAWASVALGYGTGGAREWVLLA
jgi:uncharacterized protein (TIGR02217 family)